MPKILRMPKRVQIHREKNDNVVPLQPQADKENVSSIPESDADLDTAARWIKLADQALGNKVDGKNRKRA